MNFQGKNIEQFMQAGEVLYALDAAYKKGEESVSKVALQKLIYLSVILAPIKDVIIHFLRFQYQVRGPFNAELQNTVDHLMGLDYVKLVGYNYINEKRILVSYSITNKGIKAVENLIKFERENEKYWWITCVCKLAINYSEDEFKSNWEGLDRVVNLVYKDPTFLKGRTGESFRTGIDIGGENDVTRELINFTKNYLETSNIKVEVKNEKRVAEIILVMYFEYLHSTVLTDEGND